MKALALSLALLLLALIGGGVWLGIVSTGVFKPDPVVEITATGGTNGTIRVVTDVDFWPYSFIDKDGLASGREIEMINEIANRLGMNLQLEAHNWSKCIDLALAHETDLVLTCAECSGGRERQALVMSTPIESDYFEVFGKEDVSSLEDLKGRRIGQMIDGNINATLFVAGLEPDIRLYPSFDEVFKAMGRGEVDFTITRSIQGAGCLKANPVPGVAPRLYAGRSYFCIGIDKQKPELAKKVDEAVALMRVTGEMHRLSEKWLTTYVAPEDIGAVLTKRWKPAVWFVSVIGALLTVLLVLGCQRLRAARELERQAVRVKILHSIVRSAPWSVKFNAAREICESVYSDELKSVLRNDIADNAEWVHLIHPEDRDRAVRESLAVLHDEEGDAQFDSEYRVLSRTGEYRWIRSAGRILLNPDGSGEMYGMCFDVDEHVRHRLEHQQELEKAIAELENEKQRAEVIRDVLNSALWRFKVSADDRIVAWEYSRDIAKLVKNDRAADSYDWKAIVHPDDYESTLKAFNATLKDRTCKTPYDVIFRMRDNDGNYNWFRSAGGIFRYPDGTGEFFGVHGEVSERIREQERLQREREAAMAKDEILLQVVKARYGYNVTVDLGTMKCSVISGVGCEGAVKVFERCSTYKEVFEEFNAHVTDSEILRRIQDLFAADAMQKLAAAGKRGYIGSVDYPTISSNPGEEGRIGWRQVHLFIGTDAAGRPVANLLGRNITAEHEEADAREKLRAAEQANRAKSEFLFSMSHDIRTPMHAIKGFADIAAKNLDDRKTVGDCVAKIQKSGDLLFSLLNSILDMSRLEAGKVKLTETPDDIYLSFTGVQSTMTEFARAKSIDLVFEFGEITDRYVFADHEKANRIFVNIISNAVKYTRPGGRIRVRCEQVGKGLYRYTFSDNGVGMSEDFQTHIYERFAREENRSAGDVRGVGLGMAICKGFVELMGGTIECRSELDIGTTFTITLPFRLQEKGKEKCVDPMTGAVVDVNERAEAKKENATGVRRSLEDLKGRRVLLVDDSVFNREVSKHYLVEAGFKVDAAASGREAVELVIGSYESGRPYDAVMMDIRMPGMSGYEATKQIREWETSDGNERHIPIIAWSANAFEEDREASLAAGMDDHIAKGVKPAVLQECIVMHMKV